MVGQSVIKSKEDVCVIDNSQEMLLTQKKQWHKMIRKIILKTFSNLSIIFNFIFYVLLIKIFFMNILSTLI